MSRQRRKPAYRLHKTGQARVRIDGKDHYLGEYGTPESRDRYDELIGDWLARNGDVSRYKMTVDGLALLYLKHAEATYRKNGKITSEVHCVRLALRHLVKVHGTTRVREFGPKALQKVRQSMIDAGYVRKSINLHISRIRTMFKWGVSEEIVPPAVQAALQSLSGLRANRSEKVRESDPVKPVPQAHVDAIEPFVSPAVWAMVRLQTLTGMRPGEVLIMRGCDLNTSGKVWEYVPQSHKTQHHERGRTIFIGPKAQGVLRPFLKTDLRAYLFSPQDVRPPEPGCTRQPGQRYSRDAYRRAIHRACERAFGMPDELRRIRAKVAAKERDRLKAQAAAWRDEHCWSPNQLRHNAATTIRREFGIESARILLGHASAVTSEIYAEVDHARARDITRKIG